MEGNLVYSKFVDLKVQSAQSVGRVWLFVTPWTAARGLPVQHQLLELAQTHVHRVSDAIQPSHSLDLKVITNKKYIHSNN